MVFSELLRNTDIVITAGPVPSELSGCLPSSNIPLELSLGNRPILWHVLLPLLDAGGQSFFICVAPDWQSAVKASLEDFSRAFGLSKERFSYSFVVLEEPDLNEHPVMQVVEYATNHRAADSVRDFMVVHFDTILSEGLVTTLLQGFQTNFASASVLYLECGKASGGSGAAGSSGGYVEMETDFICVDDTAPSSQAPGPAPGTICFAEHRRLHLSEPMPCDPEHALRSNMLMRRPNIIFTKSFSQLPVYLFRPWVAQVLQCHFKYKQAAAQAKKESAAAASNAAGGGGSKKALRRQQEEEDEDDQPLQSKFREDFIPALLLCQFSSFVASLEGGSKKTAASPTNKNNNNNNNNNNNKTPAETKQQLLLRAITSAQRLREELGLPESFKFPIPPHWIMEQPLDAATLVHRHGAFGEQQVDISDITLDKLNAMTSSLASPHDSVRVFATLCRRSVDKCCDVPEVRRINSAVAYDMAAQCLCEGLALPPPPVLTALQKFAVPDMHAATLRLLSSNDNDKAPANLQRCGLLSLPPPGCRVERCIVGRDVKFGEKCNLFDSVIMDGADVGAGATVKRCVVGPRCTVKGDLRHEGLLLSWAGEVSLVGGTGGKRK